MQKCNPAFAWLICFLGALFYCYEYLLRILPSVMAPHLMQSFNIDATTFGSLIAFYYLAYDPLQLPVGVLMDRYGPKKLLVFAALICALGSILFAHNNLVIAYTGRFLVGFGSAFAFVGAMKLATVWLPPSRFALAVGLVMTLAMLSTMSGDIILSKLVETLGWKTVVNLLAVLGIIIAGLIKFIVPDINTPDSQNDSASLKGSFKALFIQLALLLKKPQLWLIGIIGCLLYLPISMFAELWGVPYLIQGHGFTNAQAASIVSMVFLGMGIGSPIIGVISDTTKKRILPMLISAVLATVTVLTIIYSPHINLIALYLLFLLLGIFSSAQTLVFPLARELTNINVAGTAIAMINMLVMIGGILFQPLIGYLLDLISGNKLPGNLSAYPEQAFHYAMLTLPIGIFIGGLLVLFIKEPHFQKTV